MKIHILTKAKWLFILLLVLIPNILLFAQSRPAELKYEIYSDKKKIGNVDIKLSEIFRNDISLLKVESTTKIKVRYLLLFSFSLFSREEILIGDNGLIEYSNNAKIDGESFKVNGKLSGQMFKFEIEENKETRTSEIHTDSYDTTSGDSPETLLKTMNKKITLRVLNLDDIQVIKQSLTWTGNKTVLINDEKINCRVIEFEGPQEKGMRLITDDEFCILVEEKGSDEDGPYHVKLVSIKE